MAKKTRPASPVAPLSRDARQPADVDASGAATKQRLVEAAARHFADFGFEGASLRAIQSEIGVNPATAHYHFGSKLALYEAIVEAYLDRIQREREERFAGLDPRLAGHARLESLLEAYVAPHLSVVAGKSGDAYGRLIARKVVETNRQGPDAIAALQPLRERFMAQLAGLFPQADGDDLARAMSFAIILMVTIPFDQSYVAMTGKRNAAAAPEAWTRAVVTFSAAGFVSLCGPMTPR